jgi:hypothetical protein
MEKLPAFGLEKWGELALKSAENGSKTSEKWPNFGVYVYRLVNMQLLQVTHTKTFASMLASENMPPGG